MNYSTLQIEVSKYVAHVQLNRPDAMNSLNQELADEIYSCFNELNNDSEIRAIVLSGAGRAFCAGGDISFLKVINSQSNTGTRQLLADLFHKLTVLARVEKPVIGALHGFVLGAGFSLALLCDLRIAAESTKFGAEFPMMGLMPELGCTHILPTLAGLGKAMELVFTARRFNADEAKTLQLVNKVVPDDKLMEEVMGLAEHIATLPPLAIGLSKTALRKGVASGLDDAIQYEANINALCYQSEDHKEATSAFFEKRKPIFKGR